MYKTIFAAATTLAPPKLCPGAPKCGARGIHSATNLRWFAVLARRAVQEYIITSIKEVLRARFNRAVELKVGSHSGESERAPR